ncbi:UvrD-helicase domain-containing protein [Desulfovibrionales bacterium]
MKTYYADLHVHSRFSRATSKALTFANLAAWAEIKGIDVLATGDFTHPQWLADMEEQLYEDGSGLLHMRNPSELPRELPWSNRSFHGQTRFMLCTEISSIYKKAGKVRKNHNLVFVPSIHSARQLNTRLAQIGNLASDGRPILGLDSRDLLEIVLETDPLAFVVPAHIWTPWFSLFGSKSGFDSLEACFGDLSGEIFALETGLSSDPEMNWLWSALDPYTLISNSDAHSGEKLGREATLFQGEISYEAIRSALRKEPGAAQYAGTVEFYPEEGKYHLDGHRKCGVVLEPLQTVRHGGLCPVCGQPLTVGVLNRVFELADRVQPVRPAGHPGFASLVPLAELLSEILGVGPGSKKVLHLYSQLVAEFGSEMQILHTLSPEELASFSPALPESVRRMRQGLVHRTSGYDGEYGRIHMFDPQELHEIRHGRTLGLATPLAADRAPTESWRILAVPERAEIQNTEEFQPNEMQTAALVAGPGPVLVLAGPGTGKTQTLLGRARHVLAQGVSPEDMLILTFTRKAARELHSRLRELCPDQTVLPRADTLHALALDYWTLTTGQAPLILSEESAYQLFAAANPDLRGPACKSAWAAMNLARERLTRAQPAHSTAYQERKQQIHAVDFTDLLEFWARHLAQGMVLTAHTHVLVDEIQDLSALQLEIVRGLVDEQGHGFFGIGDPQQSIYGFRGAQGDVESRLRDIWPDIKRIRLVHNYRSGQNILDASAALFPQRKTLIAQKKIPATIHVLEAPNAEQEHKWIIARMRDLLGGTGHWQADTMQTQGITPGDIAVLVRIKALIAPIQAALHSAGIPVSVPETEPFFTDPRIRLLLACAAQTLGVPEALSGQEPVECPEKVIAKGPLAMAAFFQERPPFDATFWKTKAFLDFDKAFRQHAGWPELLNTIELETELSALRSRAQKVSIMTMHAAKGLEFDAVFLPALEEGLMPFLGMDALLGKTGQGLSVDMDEERRLLYVAMTRARRHVFISAAHTRTIFGSSHVFGLSSFIRALPAEYLTASRITPQVRQTERHASLF